MIKEIREKYPQWCGNEETKFDLCLSDDLDSLFSCIILNKIRSYEVKYFYDFNNIYEKENHDRENIPCIGVDIDLIKGKCWGNHVTMLSANDNYNKQCANLNNILKINPNNYYTKFCGSTVLQIISYYNIDTSNLSEEAKMILLCIDSTFLGYWFNNGQWCKKYLEMLELDDLLDVLYWHDKQEFEQINYRYNLKSKIYIDDDNGKLNTNIRLDKLEELFPNLSFVLPKINFECIHSFNYNTKYNTNFNKNEIKNLFSFVVTGKNKAKYSIK